METLAQRIYCCASLDSGIRVRNVHNGDTLMLMSATLIDVANLLHIICIGFGFLRLSML